MTEITPWMQIALALGVMIATAVWAIAWADRKTAEKAADATAALAASADAKLVKFTEAMQVMAGADRQSFQLAMSEMKRTTMEDARRDRHDLKTELVRVQHEAMIERKEGAGAFTDELRRRDDRFHEIIDRQADQLQKLSDTLQEFMLAIVKDLGIQRAQSR